MLQSLPRTLCLVAVLLVCACAARLHAQGSIAVLRVDAGGYPVMTAEYIVLDALGVPVRSLTADDFVATENGIPVAASSISVSCPPDAAPQPIHAVLVADRSGSMGANVTPDLSRFEMLKIGASAFARAVRFTGNTAVAITSFSDLPDVNQDFTTSITKLEAAIDALAAGDGTEYMPALLDRTLGAIPMLMARPNSGEKRVVVFITDGLPRVPPNVDSIVNAAKAGNITIYTITIGLPMTDKLKEIADRTGGLSYGDVNSADQMRAVYTSIALRSQGVDPCRINWTAEPGCGANSIVRTFELSVPSRGISASAIYRAPENSAISLQMVPDYVWFGPISPPSFAQRNVTLTARGSAINIDDFDLFPGTGFSITDWGGTAPPFTLAKDETRTITVEFRPNDSAVTATAITLRGAPCRLPQLALSGGVISPIGTSQLKLLTPIGGEDFSGCDSVPIRWGGILPTEPVKLEYSSDGGRTWELITSDVTGLQYRWKPGFHGSNFKIRVTAKRATEPDTLATAAGGGGLETDGIPSIQAAINVPSGVALDGNLLYLAEAAGHRVRRVDMFSGLIRTIAGAGGAGSNGDGGQALEARMSNPSGIAVAEGMLYIADYSNHRVRRVDLSTGVITTIAGNGGSGFSGDGGPAVDAELQYPTAVAVGRNAVYISDQGNNRIRKIDTRTNIITTIAGGGTPVAGDGSPALDVVLNKPGAIVFVPDPRNTNDTLLIAEENGHRVRAVDLRTRLITTIAGTGTAGYNGEGNTGRNSQLNRPRGLWVYDELIYITEAGSNRVRVLNRVTTKLRTLAGTGIAGFNGDRIPALTGRIGAPDGVAADFGRCFFSDVGSDRIRIVVLNGAGGSDSSANPFTVDVGRVSVAVPNKLATFDPTAVNAWRELRYSLGLCNSGNIPLLIDSVRIIGPNADDFTIVSGIPTGLLDPSVCVPLEVRFTPLAVGQRRASAVFYGRCSGNDTLHLYGIGRVPCSFALLDRAEAEPVIIGATRDTLIKRTICNTGTGPLTGTVTLMPASSPFSIVNGGGAFSLAPNECRDVTVRFTPTEGGPIAAFLEFGLAPECGFARTLIVARGLAPAQLSTALTITYPDDPCATWPRDTVLTLTNTGDAPLVITDIRFTANDEGFTILSPVPTPGAPLEIPGAEAAQIRVRWNPASLGAKSATLRITSNAQAGPTDIVLSGRKDSVGIVVRQNTVTINGTGSTFPVDSTVTIVNTGTVPITIGAGTMSGTNADRFEIPAGVLPLVIQPGDSGKVIVRALDRTSFVLTATLTLSVSPACDSSTRTIAIIETGNVPVIVVNDLAFDVVRCPQFNRVDSVLAIRNPGAAPLTITGITLGGPNPSMFAFTATPPITIQPGQTYLLPIRFLPPAPGAFTAQLRITSNAANGTANITLSGEKLDRRMTARPASISFGTIMPGGSVPRTVRIANIGTATIPAALITAGSGFSVQGSPTLALVAGDSIDVTVLFNAMQSGPYRDTLVIRDTECGLMLRIPLDGDVTNLVRTTASLPNIRVLPADTASIPMLITLPDRPAFIATGNHTYTAVVTFDGRLLVPHSTQGATMANTAFDRSTGMQAVTFTGSYNGIGDTLLMLKCRVPSNAHGITELRFVSFTWDTPEVVADTINGTCTVEEGCGPGMQFTAQIKALKIRPQPASGAAVAQFELGEEHTVAMSIRDVLGYTVATIGTWRLPAGAHTIPLAVADLPAGTYRLLLETPFGSASVPVVVVR